MTSALHNFTSDIGPEVYYSDGFRTVIEQHIDYLRTHPTTKSMMVNTQESVLYHKDFFGFLMVRKVPKHLHWIIMRVNDLYSPLEFNEENSTLLQPDQFTIDLIRQQYEVQQKIF